MALAESSLSTSFEEVLLDTSNQLNTTCERVDRQLTDIDALMKRRTELVDIINILWAEHRNVGAQLKGSPLEGISQLEKQRQDFLADIDSNNMEIGSIDARLDELSKEISALESESAKAKKKEARERLLSDKLRLAQRAADAISKVYEAFANDVRLKIEAKTKEIFKKLVWKESHFQDVRVTPEFNLEVIDRWNTPARPELNLFIINHLRDFYTLQIRRNPILSPKFGMAVVRLTVIRKADLKRRIKIESRW